MGDLVHGPALFIDGGVHRNARIALGLGEAEVGADGANAVVVSDIAAPRAFKLRWDGAALRCVATGCDAVLDGRTLRRGRERAVKRTARLSSGGVAFRLELPDGAVRAPGPASRLKGFALGVGCASALLVTSAMLAAPSLPQPRMLRATPDDVTGSIAPAAPVKVALAAPIPPTPRPPDPVAELRRRLSSAGLDGISLDAQPDGSVSATGQVAPSKADAWSAARQWLDGVAGGRIVLVNRVQVSAAAALQVQAVYTGRVPYVIDGEGQKLFVGAALPDGGTLQAIEKERVLVRHGDRVVAVRF